MHLGIYGRGSVLAQRGDHLVFRCTRRQPESGSGIPHLQAYETQTLFQECSDTGLLEITVVSWKRKKPTKNILTFPRLFRVHLNTWGISMMLNITGLCDLKRCPSCFHFFTDANVRSADWIDVQLSQITASTMAPAFSRWMVHCNTSFARICPGVELAAQKHTAVWDHPLKNGLKRNTKA